MSVGLEKRIELEMRGRPADQIAVLNLDNCKANRIEGFKGNFTNLQMLSLINSGLQTLEGFPKLSNLKKLDLSDNRISGGLDHLTGCTKLTHLSLSGNKIKNMDILDGLSLDLFNCEVTNIDQYREKVFAKLSQITYLDGFDRDEQEEADDENDENDDDEEDELSGEEDEDSDDEDDDLIVNGLEDKDDDDDDDDDDEDDDGDSDDSESSDDESASPRGTKRKLDKPTEDDDV